MMRFLFGRKKPVPAPSPQLVPPDPLAAFYAEAEAAGRRFEEERTRATLSIEPSTHEAWVADGEVVLRTKAASPPRAAPDPAEPTDMETTGTFRRLSRRP